MLKTTILSLCLAVSVVCQAAGVPKEWKQRYKSVASAVESKDMTAFKALFDESFVTIDDKGKETGYAEFLKMVENLLAGATKVKAQEKLSAVKVKGDTAEAAFELTVTIKKSTGTTVVHEVGNDYWKKIGGKWVMVKTVDKVLTVKESKKKKG